MGVEDDSTLLYRTVLETYGQPDIDTTRIAGVGTFLVLAGLDVGLAGLTGDVTPQSVVDAMKTMTEAELPGGGGLEIRCDGPDRVVCTHVGAAGDERALTAARLDRRSTRLAAPWRRGASPSATGWLCSCGTRPSW